MIHANLRATVNLWNENVNLIDICFNRTYFISLKNIQTKHNKLSTVNKSDMDRYAHG